MTTLILLSPWVLLPDGNPYAAPGGSKEPQVRTAFPLESTSHVGDQPAAQLIPDPNFMVIRVVATDAVAAAIAADPVWGPRILMEE